MFSSQPSICNLSIIARGGESDTKGLILSMSVTQGASARHKGFISFKQCKTRPCARRSNCGPLPALLAHGRHSYQLFSITSSIHGHVFAWRWNNQSESRLSLPLRSGTPWHKRWQDYQSQMQECAPSHRTFLRFDWSSQQICLVTWKSFLFVCIYR